MERNTAGKMQQNLKQNVKSLNATKKQQNVHNIPMYFLKDIFGFN